MKTKLLLIIACSIATYSIINIASEKQSWSDWARAKWAEFTGSRQVKLLQERAKHLVPTLAIGSQAASYTLTSSIPEQATDLAKKIISKDNTQIVLYSSIALAIVVTTIYGIVTYYKTGSWTRTDAVIRIKDVIRALINDSLVYPTRSSKLHALIKKDEFKDYVTDEYGLVQEACDELIKEINAISYSQDQQTKDRAIDAQMTKFKNMINQYATLDEQITALENQKQNNMNIPEMQAYLSVYFRLKNKKDAELKLSEEQQASRQAERQELTKAAEYLKNRVSEPSVD